MVKLTSESKISGEVRYIEEDGTDKMVDILLVKKLASEAGLDVVIMSDGEIPVVKIFDYGKFIYQKQKKEKAGRQKSKVGSVKEIKFHVNTEKHDYEVKLNRIVKFLEKDHKVKVSIQFRGREMAHKNMGRELLERVVKETSDIGKTESNLQFMGRQCFVLLSPKK